MELREARVGRVVGTVALGVIAACGPNASIPDAPEAVASAPAEPVALHVRPSMTRPPPVGQLFDPTRGPPGAASYASPTGCASPVSYYGGPIITSPQVVQVSWNDPTSSVAPSVQSYLQTWWPAILSPQAGYLKWLTEYNTAGLNGQDGLAGSNQIFAGSGTYAGLFPITPSAMNQGSVLTDAAVAAELVAQIDAGHLPAPTFDATGNANTMYMIDFAPNVTDIAWAIAGGVYHYCGDYCAYHSGTTYHGNVIYYGIFPDLTTHCSQCSPHGFNPDSGQLHSHELAEAMTDAQSFLEPLTLTSRDPRRPGAWDSADRKCEEIGDSCAWPTTLPTVLYNRQSYPVSGLWDNKNMGCETSLQCDALAPGACGTLAPGKTIQSAPSWICTASSCLNSCDGQTILQNVNGTLYLSFEGTNFWQSPNSVAGGNAVMQPNGDFVLLSQDGTSVVWDSNTAQSGCYLQLQDWGTFGVMSGKGTALVYF